MAYKLINDLKYVISIIKDEGFHYCFKHYSNFEEIEDDKFHELREQYLKSADELEKYIHSKYDELLDSEFTD